MTTPTIERLWNEANQACAMGQLPRAVECLRRILSQAPEFSEAHALLAICLVDMKRLGAADIEAKMAVSLDASSMLAHRAMAHVCTARRRFSEAEEHYRRLLEMEPESDDIHRDVGELYDLMGRKDEAEQELARALELQPDEPDNLTALGVFQLGAGRIAEAERFATEALRSTPHHLGGLVLMGRVALRRGDLDKAREHAHWALRIDATDVGALHLMAAIKAKSNWFLGLWWHYNTWTVETGTKSVILVLLIAFVAYRVARQVLIDGGSEQAADLVQFAWLGICIYTWVGPGLFRKELEKELGQVNLSDDF